MILTQFSITLAHPHCEKIHKFIRLIFTTFLTIMKPNPKKGRDLLLLFMTSDVSVPQIDTEKLTSVLFSKQVIRFILVLVIGLLAYKILTTLFARFLKKSRIDINLHAFLKALLKVLLIITILITAGSTIGISMNSFVVLLSAVSLAASLAVKDSLANLAGGILLLLSKPISVGDYIEAPGISGTVQEIGILHTKLSTVDNKNVFIPNGQMSNAVITNYSKEENRRIDLTIGVAYDSDIEEVKGIISGILKRHPSVLQDADKVVRVTNLGASSVDFTVRAWAKNADYFATRCDLLENIKEALDEAKVEIPFNQLDVHVK